MRREIAVEWEREFGAAAQQGHDDAEQTQIGKPTEASDTQAEGLGAEAGGRHMMVAGATRNAVIREDVPQDEGGGAEGLSRHGRGRGNL
jgi:hypothetical protein